MSNGITLSAATRANLLSLQGTADLLATTQNRLATNKKVNSALDNPTNFFTADSLSSRSAGLSKLLDGISNGIQTIQAANTGLTKLQGLTDQLKSVAQQALSSSNAFTSKATSTSVALTGATAANLLSTGPTQAVSDTIIGAAAGSTAAAASAVGSAAYATNGVASTYTGAAATLSASSNTQTGGSAAITITGSLGTQTVTVAAGRTGTQAASDLNAVSAQTGVGVTWDSVNLKLVFTATTTNTNTNLSVQAGGANELGIPTSLTNGTGAVASTAQTLTINGTAITIGATATGADAAAAINLLTSTTGVSASWSNSGGNANKLVLTGASDGSSFTVQGAAGNTLGFAASATKVTGTFVPTATSLATALGFATGDSFTVNGQSVSIAAGDNVTSIAQKVSTATNGTVSATFDATNRKFNFTAADANTAITFGNGSTATSLVSNLGYSVGKTSFAAGLGAANSTSALKNNTLTVTVGSGSSTTFTFGTAPGQISTLTQLNASLATVNAQASIDSVTGKIAITSTNDYGADNLTVAVSGGSAFSAGVSSAIIGGDGASTRTGLVSTYNNLLNQVNQLASDAGFNGLNLLAGDSLKLSFNEKGSSSLNVQGTAISASNLGLNAVGTTDFQENGSIAKVMSAISSASSQLKAQASSLGSNLAVVQNRQDFTKQIINVLDTGAANLTNADLNEEAANSQALSTRNSLGISALALANQAQQGVLQLLR